TVTGERRPEADRRRRLTHAALLVAEGDDARGAVRLQRRRLREFTQRATGRSVRGDVDSAEFFGRAVPLRCHPDIPLLLVPDPSRFPRFYLCSNHGSGCPQRGLRHPRANTHLALGCAVVYMSRSVSAVTSV